MAREKAPAFQFYPKDFLSDERVQMMTYTERGVYITLLCSCWTEGSIPADLSHLAALLRWPTKRFEGLWQGPLSKCFRTTEDGRLIHKRLEEEREKQEIFRRRQSDKGKKGGRPPEKPGVNHGKAPALPNQTHGKALLSPISDLRSSEKREEPASLSPAALSDPKRDPFTDQEITERAGRFVDRYVALYQEHRHGARYALKPARDYQSAVSLCETWTDDSRLEKLAKCFLTTNHKFAAEGARTISQFLALASWCDGELAKWEAQRV